LTLREIERRLRRARLSYGHGTHEAREEATWLFTSVKSPARRKALLDRRIRERIPLAYLLIMFASGQHAPSTAARVVIWLWGAAMTAAAVCGEAIWRNRLRLERILEEQSAEPRS